MTVGDIIGDFDTQKEAMAFLLKQLKEERMDCSIYRNILSKNKHLKLKKWLVYEGWVNL